MIREAAQVARSDSPELDVDAVIRRAQVAAAQVEHLAQELVDRLVALVGWRCYQEDAVRRMSEFAHASTGLGDPDEMVELHRRRVLGVLRDLHGVRTVGLVDEQPELGLARFAKPVGIVAATCPATAPCATAVLIALPILKTRNAVVLIPSPRGREAVALAVSIMREAVRDSGLPADLVQLGETGTRADVTVLMGSADLVVATGGARALRRAYSSGTPVIGAGV